MTVQVMRLIFGDMSTQGLMAIDGTSKFHTLEPAFKSGMLMPEGAYQCKKTMSPRMHYVSPEIFDVPGHVGERIHIGDAPEDTLGCVLVGTSSSPNWVGGSREAFAQMMEILPDEFELQITNHTEEA